MLFIPVYGQNENDSQNQNSNNSSTKSSHISSMPNFVDIDTLSYLKINKLIYYQTPIEIYKGNLVDTLFVPDWYKAYCLLYNVDFFRKNPVEALNYLHKSCSITTTKEISQIINDSSLIKRRNFWYKEVPYDYVFGEIWLTYKETNQDFILVLCKNSEKKLVNLKLGTPKERNDSNEKLDFLKYSGFAINTFIREDGVLKLPDQTYISNLLEKNGTSILNLTLKEFKNLLYRSSSYKRSNIDVKKKRKFDTLEKNGKERVIKSIQDKP